MNRLANETSPYLLQHAENPVDWYPWGDAAFEAARAEDKPIFLSIGYSTCHWCHVMAHESFEDPEIAALLNQSFISVKVDREERPDIDSVYMDATAAMTGSGGWPNNLFLTADGKPFFAGTYFPKTAGYGMPAFSDVLRAIAEAWAEDRASLLQSADAITDALRQTPDRQTNDTDLIGRALASLQRSFDGENGGFGPAPKFPMPHTLLFLLQQAEKHHDETALHMATCTLERMYAGGLFDHIGGGFCRYSTDARFLVPHFEKMLYDNALLTMCYCKAYELTGDRYWLDIAERTVSYLLRDMRAPDGGFFCAQDADSEGGEGQFYLFTPEEVISVLGTECGAAFNACFDITAQGNFAGKSIPNLLAHPREPDRFEAEKQALYAYRKRRMQLHTDDKRLTFWNALTAAALCTLYRVGESDAYLDAARETYAFLQRTMQRDGVLYTSERGGHVGSRAFLDDHAGMAFAAIALYDATLDAQYLTDAKAQIKVALEAFSDPNGGFAFSGNRHETLLVRSKKTDDGALPSGNALLTYVLVRLSELAPEPDLSALLHRQLAFMKAEAADYPTGHAMFLLALSDWEEPPMHVVAAGDANARLPLSVPIGTNVIRLLNGSDEYPIKDGKPTYYVCRDHVCLPPSHSLG